MWLCPSIKVGMTVLPVRSTRVAFAGGCRSPFRPTQVKDSPSSRNAELSIVGLLSPTISRAPSNQAAGRPAWEATRVGRYAAARIRRYGHHLRGDMNAPRETLGTIVVAHRLVCIAVSVFRAGAL